MKKYTFYFAFILVSCTDSNAPTALPSEFITKGNIVVANGGDGSVSILDGETFQEKQRLFVSVSTQRYPHHIYFSKDYSKLSVALPSYDFSQGHANAHSSKTTGELVIYDVKTGKESNKISLPAPNHDVLVDSDAKEIWTQTIAETSKVLVYDYNNVLLKQITVNEDPAEILFAKNNTFAVLAGEESSFLTVIDKKSKTIIKEIKIDNNPTGLSMGRNDAEILVSNTNKKSINIVNLTDFTITDFIDLDFKPGYAYFKNQTEVWILAPEQSKIKVFEKNAGVWKMKAELNTEKDPHHFIFFKNAQNVILANQQSNSLQVFDATNYKLIKTIKTGSKPNGIAIWE